VSIGSRRGRRYPGSGTDARALSGRRAPPFEAARYERARATARDVQSALRFVFDVQSAFRFVFDVQSALRFAFDVQSAYGRAFELQSADVQSADVQSADVQSAEVQSADVQSADVQSAEVQSAEVQSADVQSAASPVPGTSAATATTAEQSTMRTRFDGAFRSEFPTVSPFGWRPSHVHPCTCRDQKD
jgi:hypothetical protein